MSEFSEEDEAYIGISLLHARELRDRNRGMRITINIICSYCGKKYGEKEVVHDRAAISGDSHGICPSCESLPEAERLAIYHKHRMFRGGRARW